MKTQITLFRITGAASILFLVFHMAFQKLFNWSETLACLSPVNRGILITYHYMSMTLFAFLVVLFLFQPKTLLQSRLKYSLLPMIAVIFSIRIITQFTHFGVSSPMAPVIIIICLLPVVASITGLFNFKK
jgi:hypothetical protein